MAEPFLGEIRLMSFDFPPKGWALCNGQVLPINQNQALFALLGTTYGGNGQTNFALPDLRRRVPVHAVAFELGMIGGETGHTVSVAELPAHTHPMLASTAQGSTPVPAGAVLAPTSGLYGEPAGLTTLAPTSIANVGGSQPHENMQPYLVVSFCIAMQGIFPSRD